MTNRNLIRHLTLTFLLALFLAAPCTSFARKLPPHQFASLQFLHPVATSPDPDTATNFRLSALYGRSGRVKGLDLNAVAGVASGDVTGLQFSGIYSGNRRGFSGVSGTFGVNHLQGGGSGVQAAFLANYDEDAFAGLQLAGVLNYTDHGFAGVQLSGVMNLNDRAGSFAQIGTVANVNAGPFAGVQIAGFLNAATNSASGAQLAIVNFAENMSGFQVGVFNTGTRFHGLKVGLVNTGLEVTGTTVGLVNMDRTSRREWVFYASNTSLYNIGFRTVLNRWSSIVSTGYFDVQGDIEKTWFLAWNFGRNIPLNDRGELTVDLGLQHIIPQKSTDPAENDRLQYALQVRALGEYRLNDGWGLFGAVGSSTRYAEYASDAPSETEFHFSAGVVLY
jgi:hypothetical protein